MSLEEEEEKGSNPEYDSQHHQHEDIELKIVLDGRDEYIICRTENVSLPC